MRPEKTLNRSPGCTSSTMVSGLPTFTGSSTATLARDHAVPELPDALLYRMPTDSPPAQSRAGAVLSALQDVEDGEVKAVKCSRGVHGGLLGTGSEGERKAARNP